MLRPIRDFLGMGCAVDSGGGAGAGAGPGFCSGRGECHNGTCLCEIRYSGDECAGPNLPYHAGISGVFFFVALISMIQLLVCVVSEYHKMKAPSILRACKVTTQKLLYFVVFLASLIRGAYFTTPEESSPGWTKTLLSAFYPLLMSGSSLIVCFWAEIFHLRDIRWEKPQFLSKSFLGFLTFNLVSYSLLVAEVVTTQFAETSIEDRSFYTHVFNGCYAVLLFIVVVFFLIYGVEVYFKVRGGFIPESLGCITAPVAPQLKHRSISEPGTSNEQLQPLQGTSSDSGPSESAPGRLSGAHHWQHTVNTSQLHQSRLGLLSQAFMLIIIVGFLFSETLGDIWKKKVPVYSRNWHDIAFRLVEIGVALWFPCVLWNCMAPEQLWILNPRRLLSRQVDPAELSSTRGGSVAEKGEKVSSPDEDEAFLNGGGEDCWICYDRDRPDPLIRPCKCSGDVSSVHHDCLRRWLVEASSKSTSPSDSLKCKVCGHPYEVEKSDRLDWERGFTPQHWAQTLSLVTLMCLAAAGAWVTVQLFEDPIVRVLSAGFALIIIYVCVRFLGLNTVSAYQRAKVSSLNIIASKDTSFISLDDSQKTLNIQSISETVAVDIPPGKLSMDQGVNKTVCSSST